MVGIVIAAAENNKMAYISFPNSSITHTSLISSPSLSIANDRYCYFVCPRWGI